MNSHNYNNTIAHMNSRFTEILEILESLYREELSASSGHDAEKFAMGKLIHELEHEDVFNERLGGGVVLEDHYEDGWGSYFVYYLPEYDTHVRGKTETTHDDFYPFDTVAETFEEVFPQTVTKYTTERPEQKPPRPASATPKLSFDQIIDTVHRLWMNSDSLATETFGDAETYKEFRAAVGDFDVAYKDNEECVIHFVEHDVYVQMLGTFNGHDETDWEEEMWNVRPVHKTVTVYE